MMNDYVDPETHRINGSRTTVYHVLDFSKSNAPMDVITRYLPLTVEQVHVALKFIEENKTEVMANYQKMLDRDARGNSPEVEAKLALSRAKLQKLLAERRQLAETCV